MKEFKDEYVLAKGWPDYGQDNQISMVSRPEGGNLKKLKYHRILDQSDCPEYELVLRRVTK